MKEIPKHIAIIMDGNGRWAKENNKRRITGHRKGVENIVEIAKEADALGVSYVTLYAFSTENWNRSKEEINGLFKLPAIFRDRYFKEVMENNIRIEMIGNKERIPSHALRVFEDMISKTQKNTGLTLVFAMNYGGRDEIVRSVQKYLSLHDNVKTITEEDIEQNLDLALPHVDLMIRTSGEQRLSNFLLWHMAYAEFIFKETYWPEYTREEFKSDVLLFMGRERRFGGRIDES